MVTNAEKEKIIEKTGANDDKNKQNAIRFALKEGKDAGMLDFIGVTQELMAHNDWDASARTDTGMFFIFEDADIAYNPKDAGNYLTGACLKRLGISEWFAKFGAHANQAVYGKHGTGWFDSSFDQNALMRGHRSVEYTPTEISEMQRIDRFNSRFKTANEW